MQLPGAAVSKKLNCKSASGQRPGWQCEIEAGDGQVSSAVGQEESPSHYTKCDKEEGYQRPPGARSSNVLKSTVEGSSFGGQRQGNLGRGRERECLERPEATAFDEVEDPEDEEEEHRSLVVVGGAIMDSLAIEDGIFLPSGLSSSRDKSEAHFDADPRVGPDDARGERSLLEDAASGLCSNIEAFEQTAGEVDVLEDNDVVVSEDNESVKGADEGAGGKARSLPIGQGKLRTTESEGIEQGLRKGITGLTSRTMQPKPTGTGKDVIETELGEEEDEGEEGEIDNSSPIASYPSEAREFCGLYGGVGEVYNTFQRSGVEAASARLVPNQPLDYFQAGIPLGYRLGGSLPASTNSSPTARTSLMGFTRVSPRPSLRQHPGLSFTLSEDVSGTTCLLGGDFVGVGYATGPLSGEEVHLSISAAQGSQRRRSLEGASSGLHHTSRYNENGPLPRPPAVLSRVLPKGTTVVPPPPPPPLPGTTTLNTLNLSPPLGFVREKPSCSPKRLSQSSFLAMSEAACGLSSGFPSRSGPADSAPRRSSSSGLGHSSCLHRITVTLLWPSLEPSAFLKTLQLPVLPYAVQAYRTAHNRRALRLDFCTMAEAVVALRRLDGLAMSYEKDGLNGMSLPFVVSSVTEVPMNAAASTALATAAPLPTGSPASVDTALKWKEGIPHAGVKREGADLTLHTPQLKRISGSRDMCDSPERMDYRYAPKVPSRAEEPYRPVRGSPNTLFFSKPYPAELRGSLDSEFSRVGRKQSQSGSLIGNRSLSGPVSFWCEHASFQIQLEDYRRLVSRFGLTNRYICLHRVPESLSDPKVLKGFLDDVFMSREEYEMEVILGPEPLSASAEPEVTVVPSDIPESTVLTKKEINSLPHQLDVSSNALGDRVTTLEKNSATEGKLRNGNTDEEKEGELDQLEICTDNPAFMDSAEKGENKQRSSLQAAADEGNEDVSMKPYTAVDDMTGREAVSCISESLVSVPEVERIASSDDMTLALPTANGPLATEGQGSRKSDTEEKSIGGETVASSSCASGDGSTGKNVSELATVKSMVKPVAASGVPDASLSARPSVEEGPVNSMSDDVKLPESDQSISSGFVRWAHLAFKTKKAAQVAFRKLQKAWHNAASVELTGPRRPNFTLWIGNLRDTMGREALESQLLILLKRYGRLKRLRLFPERSCAFATFETLEGARAARNHLHGFLFGKQMHSILLNVDFLAATGGTPSKGGSATGRLTVEEKTHEADNARRFCKICEFCAQRHKKSIHQADLDASQSGESPCHDLRLENVCGEQKSESIAAVTPAATDGASASATNDNPSDQGEKILEEVVPSRVFLSHERVTSESDIPEGRLENQQRFSSAYDNGPSLCDSWETARTSHGRDVRERTLSGDTRHWGSGLKEIKQEDNISFARTGDSQHPFSLSGRSPPRRAAADRTTRTTEDVGLEKCIDEPRDRRRVGNGADSPDCYRNYSKIEMSRGLAYGAERHRAFRNETGRYSSQPKQQEQQRHQHFSRQQQRHEAWVQRRERSPGYRGQSGTNPDCRFSSAESRTGLIEEPHFSPQESQQHDRQEERQRRLGRALPTSLKSRRSPSVVPLLRKSPGVMTPPKRKRRNDSPSRPVSYREGRAFLLSGGNGARRIPQEEGSPPSSAPFVNNQQYQPSWRKRREHLPSRIRIDYHRHHPLSGVASSAQQPPSPSRQQHHRPLPREMARGCPDEGEETIANSGLPTAQGRNGISRYSSHYRRRHRRSCSSSWSSSSSAGDDGRHRSDHNARSCSSNVTVMLPQAVVNQDSEGRTEDTGSNATVINSQARTSQNRGSVSECATSGRSQQANSESGDVNISMRARDDSENTSSGYQNKEGSLKSRIAFSSPAVADSFGPFIQKVTEDAERKSGSADVPITRKGLHVKGQAAVEQAHRPSSTGDVCQLCKQGQRLCRLRFEFERGDSSIELPLTLDVSTRSTAEKLQSMLSRRSEKYGVWRLLPDTEDEKPAYISFCGYFKQRQRIGLLEATNATLFIVPLEPATSSEFQLVTNEVTLFAFVFPRRTKLTNLHS